jgi:[ribosomal protein S5]-alanine N-acetyltransferase
MEPIIKLNEIPVLQTERLLLRKLTLHDAEDIFEYAHVPEVTKYVIWFPHKTKHDSIEFVRFAEKQFNEISDIVWGIEPRAEKKIIGTIGLVKWRNEHRCGEIGYCIAKDFWGKGITTEALKAVIGFSFRTLNLNRVEAHCEEENIGSWKVMQKAGMKFEGVLREKVCIKGTFRSMKVYSILKREYDLLNG